MSTAWLPDLPGNTWGGTRTAKLSTLIQTTASGLEARQGLQVLTRREFELSFNYLRENTPWFDVEKLEGFWLARLGPLSTFFYRDAYENTCTAQFIATGDGVKTAFQLQRTIQGYNEPVFALDTRGSATYGPYTKPAAPSLQAYVNAIAVSASFNLETGVMTLATASGTSGLPISATFGYGFRCRFSDDELPFNNRFANVYEMKSLKIIQTRV